MIETTTRTLMREPTNARGQKGMSGGRHQANPNSNTNKQTNPKADGDSNPDKNYAIDQNQLSVNHTGRQTDRHLSLVSLLH